MNLNNFLEILKKKELKYLNKFEKDQIDIKEIKQE